MSEKIRDRVFVVTGGARGIGCGIAASLAARGGRIAILDLDQASMDEAAHEIGGDVRTYVCNITDEAAVEETFTRIVSDFGRIDGLVNNAGIIRDSLLVKNKGGAVTGKMTAEQFDLVINVCLKGAFLCAREAVAHMIEGKVEDGILINISSGSFRGNFGQTNYSAAKAGLVAMSAVWAKEYGRNSIRSMVIAPGPIDTELLRSMPPEAMKGLVSQVPVRRVGQIDNIAQAARQIIENDFLTGSIIEVNGGLTV